MRFSTLSIVFIATDLLLRNHAFMPSQLVRKRCVLSASLDGANVTIVGPKTGVATSILDRFSNHEKKFSATHIDRLEKLSNRKVIDASKILVLSADAGPDINSIDNEIVLDVLSSIPSNLEYLFYVHSPEPTIEPEDKDKLAPLSDKKTASTPGDVFKKLLQQQQPSSPLAAVRQVADTKVVIIHTGRLFGVVSGPEPIPFVGGPKAEPVLNESWTRKGALIGAGNMLALSRGASTKRSIVAETIIQYLNRHGDIAKEAEFSIVSVEGMEPSSEEWSEELARIDSGLMGVSVLSLEFEAMPKKDALMAWLVNTWGPSMLRKVESNMIRSGSRPVRVAKLATDKSSYATTGVQIIWEAPTKNLEIEVTGRLQVLLRDDPNSAGLRVVRCDGIGEPKMSPLIGEDEIVQSLLEGLNIVAYNKGFVTRKISPTKLFEGRVGVAKKEIGSTVTSSETMNTISSSSNESSKEEGKGRRRRIKR